MIRTWRERASERIAWLSLLKENHWNRFIRRSFAKQVPKAAVQKGLCRNAQTIALTVAGARRTLRCRHGKRRRRALTDLRTGVESSRSPVRGGLLSRPCSRRNACLPGGGEPIALLCAMPGDSKTSLAAPIAVDSRGCPVKAILRCNGLGRPSSANVPFYANRRNHA